MSSNNPRTVRSALLTIPLLFVALVVLQRKIDVSAAPLQRERPELLVQSGMMLKKMSLGYDALLADIYWTRAIQYFGERTRKPGANFDLLGPLLDITTTLDPKLLVAYRFGAIFLSEPRPAGVGRPDLAVNLVKKGIAANPDEWRLYDDLGFLYSIHLRDNQKASEAYLEGSKNPKAQIWMRVMAAHLAEKGDAVETSKLIWEEVYATTGDDLIRRRALEHIKALDAAIDLRRLNLSSEDYQKRLGRYPKTIQEMRDAGLVGGQLRDPAGYPYTMGAYGVPQLDPASPIALDPDQK
jgi:hypothetical protein